MTNTYKPKIVRTYYVYDQARPACTVLPNIVNAFKFHLLISCVYVAYSLHS